MRKVLNGLIGNFRIDDSTGCWNWIRCKTKGGYAQGSYAGKRMSMSRIVAVLYHGLDHRDTKTLALHRCDNRACVNPKHIFIGSHLDNLLDCLAKGRMRHHGPRLTCFKGHPLTQENTIVKMNGHRTCRMCQNARNKAWREKNAHRG